MLLFFSCSRVLPAAQVACELELWQEAFRSVEDIQSLFVLGKRPAKPQMMAVFYARLTKIFTVSEYHLQNGYDHLSPRHHGGQPQHIKLPACKEP